ncbi:odorant receptor 67c-like [Apis dorsata]|uniref:odorant receptor 67c-like n=1 Tax=Apis dorsata TaxID=7462 RepID=UPI0003DF7B89|nr:odorant receptor 67c-like [Apis dorsata]
MIHLREKTSMNIQKDLKYLYGWNYYTMKLIGIWPEERKWNQASNYLVLIPFLMIFCFICAPQTINLSLISNDFNLVIENLSMGNITITLSLLKTIAFWINGKPLKSLLNCMTNDWIKVTSKTEQETMARIANITRNTIIRSTMMCHTVVAFYVFLRYISMKYNENKLLFRAYFPYDITVSPNYELTMLGQFVAALYAATSYTAVDTFVAMLILHVCGQLSGIKNELSRLPTYDKKDLETRLKEIVQRHEYVNRFAETIENCFNVMLLIQILGCTVQLCFQCFQAIMSFGSGEAQEYLYFQLMFLFIYVFYVMLQLYLYCYVGERLSVESMEIANAAYNTEWYTLPPKITRMLIIVMCRAKSPLTITAGRFCSFTLQLFSEVLKTSMRYLSVLYAVKDKIKH